MPGNQAGKCLGSEEMIRLALLAFLACLPGCAQPPAQPPHTDGDIVTRAVQTAQAKAEHPGVRRELRK